MVAELKRKKKPVRRDGAGWKWIWNKGRGLAETVLFPFTILASLYGVVCRLRIFLYRKGVLSQKKVDCRVISIGNLTVGGTGKTPFTIFLAEQWRERGYTVGIVSRGYRGNYKGPVRWVSDGREVLEGPETVGDEPYLMAQRLSGIPVVVSADRFKGCRALLERFKPDVILLDDGFQHLRLHRDLNLLLVDATNPFGNGALLPRGSLREPLSGIRRADVVIFTRSEDPFDASEWVGEIERLGLPCIRTAFIPARWVRLKTGETLPPSALAKEPVVGFSGIGNPESFSALLHRIGVDLRAQVIFRDHHVYQAIELEEIQRQAGVHGAKRVVTTEKDAVKIKGFIPADLDVWALQVEVVFWEGQEKWEPLLLGGRS